MRLLLVASDSMEFRGLLPLTETPRRASAPPLGWARCAKMNGHEVLLVANGVGWKRAAAAVNAACVAFRPEAIASTGFCGALDPKLRVGEVVVGACVAGGARRYSALPLSGGGPYRTGTVISIDHVAQLSKEKQALHAQGGSVVEMEAAAVAERAEAHALPFYCVRAVTDLADEDMANDFNSALRSDGHFDTMRIFREMLRHPAVRLPELIRLHNRCLRAGRSLGEFFADCRF